MVLENYFDQYMNFSFSKIKKLETKYDPKNLFHDGYSYDDWYEELDDNTLKKSDDSILRYDEKNLVIYHTSSQ